MTAVNLGQPISEHRHETLVFPEGFLWGTATAAYQAEGNNKNSDWWKWEKENPQMISEPAGISVDHYHRYEEDLNLARELNTNFYRLSIEWSRIVPAENEIDRRELEHYANVLRACRTRGIKTMVTLHHFTNPQWFMDKGGWVSSKAPALFCAFVKTVVAEYSELVDYWVTFNEPMVYVSQGYVTAAWAPAKRNYWHAFRVFNHLVAAHRAAYKIIHKIGAEKKSDVLVGAANNLISLSTYRKHKILDNLYAYFVDLVWNHLFIAATRQSHDYIGVNYYFHQRINPGKRRLFGLIVDIREEQREMSDIGWEVYPTGFFDALLDVNRYKLPIIITENGIATKSEGRRARYIVSYVKELYHAIAAGIDIRGYCYWTLMDNYEWEKGFNANFGLVAVARPSLERTIKSGGRVYGEICKANGITHDLLRFTGHGARLDGEDSPDASV
jgi:beta-glucosidase